MSKIQLAYKYLKYRLNAKTKFDIHSPFIFDFVTDVIGNTRHYYAYDEIEMLREHLLNDERTIRVEDFGAGSKKNKTPDRRIADIAKNTLITPKFGRLLFSMVDHYRPATLLELGTSLGISALYLAKANTAARLITLEGSVAVASIAATGFKQLHAPNIELITGEFSQTLPEAIRSLHTVDLAFIDGNHRYAPTMEYFRQLLPATHAHSILVFDDIHWSDEMEAAWKEIQAHPQVTLTFDLFFKGIVFLHPEIRSKQHFQLLF